MKLAFCLYKYFPYGGLQRDFLRIATECIARGHEAHVYTMHWEGDLPDGLSLHLIDANGWQNHTRCLQFVKKLRTAITQRTHDLIVGFNKMPGLDVYFAADDCLKARIASKPFFMRWLPRYRTWISMEKAVFDNGLSTKIMLISPKEKHSFSYHYQTEHDRFLHLPPGIARDRIPRSNAAEIRNKTRAAFAISEQKIVLLMVGSSFKTKGVDRAIRAIASLPAYIRQHCHLLVLGKDNPKAYLRLSKKLGLYDQVRFLGGRHDVPHFLLAADILIHPAYHENTGAVILEGIVSGLPVLTVASCGYAHYVSEADAGIVIASPFKQVELNKALEEMVRSKNRKQWRRNGIYFAQKADLYSLPQKAADYIEQVGFYRGCA